MTSSTATWRMLAALAIVPLLANWPVVSGWLSVDPIYTLSGLGTDLVAGPLPGPTNLDPDIGVTTQALGRLAATEWLAGRIPWWNPFDGVGLPLSAEGQNQALFLPFVLLLALRNGPLLLLLALQEVAAFSTYALLRQMALTRTAAWIGAALFAINGTFAWFSCGPMMPIAFAPMFLLGIEMQLRAPRSSRGWMVIAIALAFSLYAGFPETAYIDGLLAGCWALLRLFQCTQGDRIFLTLRLGAGAVTGLLLAAPFVVPFLHMLSVADLGSHALDFSGVAAPPAALPVLLMPYVLGPQSFGVNDPSQVLLWLWAFLGGYISLPIALLAVIAVAARRAPNLALRGLLAAWCAATIAASFGVPGITRAVYSIPPLSQTLMFRYAPPSWELAAIVLAAMAIDDWQRTGFRPWRLGLALASVLTAAAVTLAAASHSIAYLRANVPHYDPWMIASVAGAATIALLTAGSIAGRPARWRAALLAVLLLGDGIALFSVPRLAGLRDAALDTSAVAYLQQHLGLQRFYALGALAPNYSAFFQLASINSLYMPTPLLWAEHITTALDPLSPPGDFTGAYQYPGRERPDHVSAFRKFLPAYQDLAVRYVLVPKWEHLAPTVRTPISTAGVEAVALASAAVLALKLPATLLTSGNIETVSVNIGTYNGASNGALSLTACAEEVCRTGAADLASAADNAPIEIALNAPLPIAAGQDLSLRFTHDGGTAAVAIWHFPNTSGAGRLPEIAVTYAIGALPLRGVYADRLMTIYELANAAPYFEAIGGPCQISATTRETVTTDCATAARLIRRELFFEGWHASIDGQPAPILPAPPIVQAVDIPSGVARIEFHYAPPYAAANTAAFVVALLVLVAGDIAPHTWHRPRQG